jgi:hypothetical protein
MLSLRTGETGDAERSDRTMNALAVQYVNTHLQELADDAQRHPSRVHRPSLRKRIASAVSHFRSSLYTPLDNRGTLFPALDASDRS